MARNETPQQEGTEQLIAAAREAIRQEGNQLQIMGRGLLPHEAKRLDALERTGELLDEALRILTEKPPQARD